MSKLLAIYALNFFRIGYQTVAIAWFATLATHRMNSVAELLLISSLSTLCLSPVIGRLVDRIIRKKALLCYAQMCVAINFLGAAIVSRLVHELDAFNLLACVTAILAATSLFSGGTMDYFLRIFIPDNIRAGKLASINTVIQIALIAGTCTAGAMTSFLSIEIGLLFMSLLAGLTALLCWMFLPNLRLHKEAETKRTGVGYFQLSIYSQFPMLFCIACAGALVFSIGQATNMLLPGLIALNLKLGSVNYSTVETAWSIGALGISFYLATAKMKPEQPIGFDLLVVVFMSAALALVPFAPRFMVLLAMHFALGVGFAFVRVRMETRFLQECPVHLLGRFRANSMALTSVVGLAIYFVPVVSRNASISYLYVSIAGVISLATLTLLVASASITSAKGRTIGE